MKRLSIVAAGVAGVLVAWIPGSTSAATHRHTTTKTTTTTTPTPTTTAPTLGSQIGTTVQLGTPTTGLVAPSCPANVSAANCTIVMTRATGLETITDGVAYPTTVKEAGQIVAFTIGLSRLSTDTATAKSYVTALNAKYGGGAAAGITVLSPSKRRKWTVVAAGPIEQLQPYLGYVVQFPLTTPIPVTPGETIGLSVSTWAPVLSYNLSSANFAYRQSRRKNCNSPGGMQNAQLRVGNATNYVCDYPGTRVEYSATEVTNPVPPGNQIK